MEKQFEITNYIRDEKIIRAYLPAMAAFAVICSKLGYIPTESQKEDIYQSARILRRSILESRRFVNYLFWRNDDLKTNPYYLEAVTQIGMIVAEIATMWKFDDISWQNDKGKLGKRFAKYVFKTFKTDITDWINTITTTLKGFYYENFKFKIVVDTDFNWNAGDFGDDGSCIFSDDGCNRHQYYRMLNSDVQAIKIYGENGRGLARALLFKPVDNLGFIRYIMINGYGKERSPFSGTSHDSQVIDRIEPFIAEMLGVKSIGKLYIHDHDRFYVNNSNGIVFIDPAHTAPIHIERDIVLDVNYGENEWQCDHCHYYFTSDDESYSTADGVVCNGCFEDYYVACDYCGEYYQRRHLRIVDGDYYCQGCVENFYTLCDFCGEYRNNESDPCVKFHNQDMCESCRKNYHCSVCGNHIDPTEENGLYLSGFRQFYVCEKCLTDLQTAKRYESRSITEDIIKGMATERWAYPEKVAEKISTMIANPVQISKQDENITAIKITLSDKQIKQADGYMDRLKGTYTGRFYIGHIVDFTDED